MISFKLPANASTAIHAVAFLLRAHTDETLAATVADHVINKVKNKISDPISKLNESIDSTKGFPEAKLLSPQNTVKQQAELVKSLTDTQPLNPRGLSDAAWPLLAASAPPQYLTGSLRSSPPMH